MLLEASAVVRTCKSCSRFDTATLLCRRWAREHAFRFLFDLFIHCSQVGRMGLVSCVGTCYGVCTRVQVCVCGAEGADPYPFLFHACAHARVDLDLDLSGHSTPPAINQPLLVLRMPSTSRFIYHLFSSTSG